DVPVGKPYADLLELVKDKDYFVLTTNVDHQFQMAGFDKKRLFYTQGDYGLWQCSKACHDKTYDNENTVRKMVKEQQDMKIPPELVPKCPKCGAPMTMNLRCDDSFVQDEGWYAAANRYEDFLRRHENCHILFLELGVGMNTPVIIKYPFWKMTAKNPKSVYSCINFGEAFCPSETESRSICIDEDIGKVFEDLLEKE
ncbi:MAG: Sir2 silent information regulator family NAD-dependent deacetylase, partial [Ruminiclostridium sp.]|nr:Sir2 silent information regulator family NAD-dependent deacetylase [Ruminiclostridium sp.]